MLISIYTVCCSTPLAVMTVAHKLLSIEPLFGSIGSDCERLEDCSEWDSDWLVLWSDGTTDGIDTTIGSVDEWECDEDIEDIEDTAELWLWSVVWLPFEP